MRAPSETVIKFSGRMSEWSMCVEEEEEEEEEKKLADTFVKNKPQR